MPTYFRRDDWVDAAIFGYSIPNIAVTYLTQPALTPATIYANPDGTGGPIPNPQYTDGLGHAVAYMLPGLYTITYAGQQIQTLTLPDQDVGSEGGGSSVTVFAGVPTGTIDGVNRVFTLVNGSTPLTTLPTQQTVWLNFPLIINVGYTLAISGGQVKVTFATAPQTGDTLYANGFYLS